MTDIKEIRDACRALAVANLRECCAELIEWQDTAVLRDGRVRELAAMCDGFISNNNGLRVAESFISRAAIDVAAKAAPVEEAPTEWKCFHCGEAFTDEAHAALHFGKTERETPACQFDVAALRETEALLRSYQAEDTDLYRQMYRMQSQHALDLRREEEKGYARGLKDANHVEPEAPTDNDALYLIHYDDRERQPEVMVGSSMAQIRFKQVSERWNAHLYVKVKSNSRDDPYYSNNLAAPATEQAKASDMIKLIRQAEQAKPPRITPEQRAKLDGMMAGAAEIAGDVDTLVAERAKESVVQQAQQWALEAKTQRATVLSILRHFGLPENDWEALSLIQAAQASPAKPDLSGLTALSVDEITHHFKDSTLFYQAEQVDALLAAITKEPDNG